MIGAGYLRAALDAPATSLTLSDHLHPCVGACRLLAACGRPGALYGRQAGSRLSEHSRVACPARGGGAPGAHAFSPLLPHALEPALISVSPTLLTCEPSRKPLASGAVPDSARGIEGASPGSKRELFALKLHWMRQAGRRRPARGDEKSCRCSRTQRFGPRNDCWESLSCCCRF